MLTTELLKKESSLQGLTDEQLNAIATLSRNDEDSVMGTKFAELHNNLDNIVKTVTGKGKETNEKTSDYLKRMLGEQKTSVDDLTAKVTALESEKATLEGKIAAGSGDKELIESQKNTIADLMSKYNKVKEESDHMKEEHEKALLDMRVSTELTSALGGLKYKTDANEEILGVLKAEAMNAIKAIKHEYIKDEKGNEVLVFKDANGVEMRNPDNQLRLYTAKELLANELSRYNILDNGTTTGGAGGQSTTPKPKTNISGARTRVEANEIIQAQAAAAGLVRGSKEYQDEVNRLTDENADVISKLPFK